MFRNNKSGSFIRFAPCLLVCLSLLLVSACSPRYDWRDVRAEDGTWAASFPDKVQSQTRLVTLDGQSLNMSMTAARVDEVTFAIGTAELPKLDNLDRTREQMITAMLRNIQGSALNEQDVMLVRFEQAQAPLTARAVTANGQLGDKAVYLSGRFATYVLGSGQAHAIQIIVLGPGDVLNRPAGQQAIETFMTSVRVQ